MEAFLKGTDPLLWSFIVKGSQDVSKLHFKNSEAMKMILSIIPETKKEMMMNLNSANAVWLKLNDMYGVKNVESSIAEKENGSCTLDECLLGEESNSSLNCDETSCVTSSRAFSEVFSYDKNQENNEVHSDFEYDVFYDCLDDFDFEFENDDSYDHVIASDVCNSDIDMKCLISPSEDIHMCFKFTSMLDKSNESEEYNPSILLEKKVLDKEASQLRNDIKEATELNMKFQKIPCSDESLHTYNPEFLINSELENNRNWNSGCSINFLYEEVPSMGEDFPENSQLCQHATNKFDESLCHDEAESCSNLTESPIAVSDAQGKSADELHSTSCNDCLITEFLWMN